MSTELLQSARARFGEIADVGAAIALMHWDQEVLMPPKAAPGRGRQLATLSAIAHRMATDKQLGEDIRRLSDIGLSGDDAKLIEVAQHDYERATQLPEAFVETLAEEQSKAYQAWMKAREAADFSAFQPHLETIIDLLKRKADYHGFQESPYDALLEDYERGCTASELRPVFATLAERQSELVKRIVDSGNQPDNAWLKGTWDEQQQWDFTLRVLRDIGYDFDAGRQDKSIHPFSTNFGLRDVRVTTRLDLADPFSALTGTIHEGGHALYEQGLPEEAARTPLGQAISLGIHESQSRMWENVIGRSRPFWAHYESAFREMYGAQLNGVSLDDIHRAINTVEPSLVRVEADECTYNLHIFLRFEIEVELIEERLKVADVPEYWNAKMKDYLGLDVPNDRLGCLQDIHWSHASIGYFPTYALGNLYASQFFARILEDHPTLWDDIAAGNFAPLLDWLRTNIHSVGRRMTASELVRHVTGKDLSAEPYLNYLETKYSELYNLS